MRLGVYITYTMQKLQHDHLAVAYQAFRMVFFFYRAIAKSRFALVLKQEGGNHFKNLFILEYAMMKYIVLTLLLINFVVLKNSSPLDLASGK